MFNAITASWSAFTGGLRGRIYLLVLLALVPALLLIVYNGLNQRQEAERQAINDATALLTRVVDKQDELIEATRHLLIALSVLPTLVDRDVQACNQLLAQLLQRSPRYISMAGFDAGGEAFCRAPLPNKPLNIADRSHFKELMRTGDFATSGYVISRLTGKRSFYAVYPVRDRSGKIVGAVNAGMDLEWLSKLVGSLPMPRGTVLSVYDDKGVVMARYPYAPELIGQRLFASGQRSAGVSERADQDGRVWLHVTRALATKGARAQVDVARPKDQVLAHANKRLQRNIALLALVGVFALVAVWVGANAFVLRHVDRLVMATRRLAQGDLGVRVGATRGGAELEALGQSFDTMVQALQDKEAARDRSETALRHLAQGVQISADSQYFDVLVARLADALQADYCQLGRWMPETGEVQTLARYVHGRPATNICYAVEGTPCAQTMRLGYIQYPGNLQTEFPDSAELGGMNVNSYAGIRLTDSQNSPLGCLVLFHSRDLPDPDIMQSLLQVFGARAATELERLRVEGEREHLLDELRLAATAFESQEGMCILDAKRRILRVNVALCTLIGCSAGQLVGKPASALLVGGDDGGIDEAELWGEVDRVGAWHGETQCVRADGSHFPVDLSVSAVANEVGEFTHYAAFVHDISERQMAEQRIKYMAYHDTLTGLPNRALLLDRLNQAMLMAHRRKQYGALLFIDLDNFKDINDSLGHKVGDMLLVELAQRLSGLVRGEDTVARLGGDEFIVLMPQLHGGYGSVASEANTLAEKILSVATSPYSLAGRVLQVGASIGVAIFPDHGTSVDDVLRHADLAMYAAKTSGRNAVRFFQQQLQTVLNERLAMESELKLASARGQFEIYHQPQIHAVSGQVVGGEVLLRWRHPERGMIDTASFIPVLEETGMIVDVGRWVLNEALRSVQGMASGAGPHPVVAINVSPRQFRRRDFVDDVKCALEDSGIAPERVELEVTEGIVIQDIEDTVTKMHALKALGVRFSIDDFGTGYSSLSYIKRLPIDTLKIDKSFIRDCTHDSNDRAIVRAIINMANGLDLQIIAEGVETPEQLELLRAMGCEYYQGYHFSPPVTPEAYRALLVGSGA